MRTITMLVLLLSLSCYVAYGQELSKEAAESRRAQEIRQCSLDLGRSLVKFRAPEEFASWNFDDLPKEVKSFMDGFLGWVVQKDVHPHKLVRPIEAKVNLSVRIAVAEDKSQDDLVEYRWTFQDRSLRVVTSLNAMRIVFDLREISACRRTRGDACVREIKAWVESVVKLEGAYDILGHHTEYRVELPWPNELSDGIAFSSAPDQNIVRLSTIQDWHRRVDAFVEKGAVTILIYKKAEGLAGYLDGSKWFSDKFRQQIRERTRADQEK